MSLWKLDLLSIFRDSLKRRKRARLRDLKEGKKEKKDIETEVGKGIDQRREEEKGKETEIEKIEIEKGIEIEKIEVDLIMIKMIKEIDPCHNKTKKKDKQLRKISLYYLRNLIQLALL